MLLTLYLPNGQSVTRDLSTADAATMAALMRQVDGVVVGDDEYTLDGIVLVPDGQTPELVASLRKKIGGDEE